MSNCIVVPLVGFPRILSLALPYCAAISEKKYVSFYKTIPTKKKKSTIRTIIREYTDKHHKALNL